MFAFFGVDIYGNRQTASLATAKNSHQSKKYSFQLLVILASWHVQIEAASEYHDVKDNHGNAWLIVRVLLPNNNHL